MLIVPLGYSPGYSILINVQDWQCYQKLIIRHIKHNFQKKMISKVFTLKKVQSSQIYDDICK